MTACVDVNMWHLFAKALSFSVRATQALRGPVISARHEISALSASSYVLNFTQLKHLMLQPNHAG